MSEYFLTVISVGVVSAVAGVLIYDPERAAASRTAISIVLLLAVSAPVGGIISELGSVGLPELPEDITVGEGEYERVAEEAFKDGIAAMLADKYSIGEDCFSVRVTGFRFFDMQAEDINVTLTGAAVKCDPLAVERYINSYGIGDCHAEIGI